MSALCDQLGLLECAASLAGFWPVQAFFMLLYAIVLFVIVRNKGGNFDAPFWKIVLSGGASDFLLFASRLFHQTDSLPVVNMRLSWPRLMASMFVALGDSSAQSSKFSLLLLGVNRFTAIVWPLRHDSIWEGRLPLRLGISVQWLQGLAIGLVLPLLTCMMYSGDHATFASCNDSAVIVTGLSSGQLRSYYYYFWSAGNTAYALLYAAIYTAILLTYRKNAHAVAAVQMRLAFVGLLLSSFIAVAAAVAYVHAASPSATTITVIRLLGHLFVYSNGVLLLLFSSALRTAIRQLFRSENAQKTARITAAAPKDGQGAPAARARHAQAPLQLQVAEYIHQE